MPTNKQIEDFAKRAIAALPESFGLRKSDAEVLMELLPFKTEGQRAAAEIFSGLAHAERAQQQFLFGKDGK